jgi:hypothetical protein
VPHKTSYVPLQSAYALLDQPAFWSCARAGTAKLIANPTRVTTKRIFIVPSNVLDNWRLARRSSLPFVRASRVGLRPHDCGAGKDRVGSTKEADLSEFIGWLSVLGAGDQLRLAPACLRPIAVRTMRKTLTFARKKRSFSPVRAGAYWAHFCSVSLHSLCNAGGRLDHTAVALPGP